MQLAPKVILLCPLVQPERLEPFVEECLRQAVKLVAVVGEGCEEVEETIDWTVVGDGTDRGRFLLTSSHPAESIEEVRRFAAICEPWGPDGIQEVRL